MMNVRQEKFTRTYLEGLTIGKNWHLAFSLFFYSICVLLFAVFGDFLLLLICVHKKRSYINLVWSAQSLRSNWWTGEIHPIRNPWMYTYISAKLNTTRSILNQLLFKKYPLTCSQNVFLPNLLQHIWKVEASNLLPTLHFLPLKVSSGKASQFT